ncbi:MAG: M23 family metallopeptidase, partial [Bacteroidetes bacterium]
MKKFVFQPILLTCVLIQLSYSLLGQNKDSLEFKYPQNYFRSPLDIPLLLAGNYGEIRSNHYHAGIDIKTEGVEGKNVYAAADGYVSRIKISEGGYGKALYITHPNGYTTVYAHLKRFNDTIEQYVRKQQYLKESYEIELFPPKNSLKVKKGDIIAVSGNTGGSGGPHLHFEIRETDTEVPINPLLFGFDIKDDIPPIIKHLTIYPIDDTSFVNRRSRPKRYALSGSNGKYSLSATPEVKGIIGFGIEVIDKLNGSNNRCGIYSIDLTIDGDTIYRHHIEDIPFHKTRYINCHVDYEAWKKDGIKTQRCYRLPNNQLDFYDKLKYNGLYMFTDDSVHEVRFIVKDTYQNTSELVFNVKSSTAKIQPFPQDVDSTKVYQFM